MGDVIADVPGGSNNHNYANVTLIVELARLHGVHAVWAGWGHASENPALPNALHRSYPPIKFIGPAGPPMLALGDKIGSTIIAQTANVPCIDWNGSHVKATYDMETGSLPQKAFEDATITNATEAQKAAERIGFPIMIKASEGGGGKGIRRVDTAEDVANCYRQVCGEVPGSPIFIMKLSANSRHLEVQLLADEYGDAVALNGRDCSVQRRHQKIIEEGPPIAANPEVWKEMEKAAIALAKAVHYTNAGTVEYLYSEREAKFFFLELNPRLQVEHPVTEMVTRVNLPAAQLQVAMGIPLYNIPEIRELYGRNRFEDDPQAESSKIDFEVAQRVEPNGHCIAVRITAENAEAGFKPTSGGIQELNFRSTPSVWGYFSMDSSGSIHEFADSQFGHLFASGPDREQARRSMVLALKELSIRGDISTTVDYISKLLELEDFVSNNIDTGWLDSIIKANVDGIGAFEGDLGGRKTSVDVRTLHNHVYAVMGATVVTFDSCSEGEKRFLDLLEKGQLPPRSLLKMQHKIELILNGVKYKLLCTRNGPNSFFISVAGEEGKSVVTNVRLLSDGGYLIDIFGTSRVVYLTVKGDAGTGMRLNVGGANIAFSPDYDPTALRTDVAGKLVKKLKEDGARVRKGEPYCEIEVMKMFMPLKVDESGVLSWNCNEGASISAGDLLATLELDNPENVSTVSVFEGDLVVAGWGDNAGSLSSARPHLMLRSALDSLNGAMAGFVMSSDTVDRVMSDLAYAVTQPTLPVYEIEEQLSVLSGRIPSPLFDSIAATLDDFKAVCEEQGSSEVQPRYGIVLF
jgi:acetyl-CoA carboxylase / biotin carboxylase 1